MVNRRVQAAIDAALEARPLPERYADVHPSIQRDVRAEAEKYGLSPEDMWARIRERAAAAKEVDAEVQAVVAKLRGGAR